MYAARSAGNPILNHWKNVSSAVRTLIRCRPPHPAIPRSSSPGKSRSSEILLNWKRSISAGELLSVPAKLQPIKIPPIWNRRFHPGCEPCVRKKVLPQVRLRLNHPLRRVRRLRSNRPPLQTLPKARRIGFQGSAKLPRKIDRKSTRLNSSH